MDPQLTSPPSIGRVVHFVLDDGQHRPAFIVRTWPEVAAYVRNECNLRVFLDGRNDFGICEHEWQTSIPQDETGKSPRTWHWPERS